MLLTRPTCARRSLTISRTYRIFARSRFAGGSDTGQRKWSDCAKAAAKFVISKISTERNESNARKKDPDRARQDAREGKAPSTQAGEFVREEMDHIREGKHGARSPQQAIAIGLSKARRAGVKLPPPKKGRVSKQTETRAERDYEKGQSGSHRKPSAKRSRASYGSAQKRRPRRCVSCRPIAAREGCSEGPEEPGAVGQR